MNIIIKKKKLENPGIDPGASRMQIERSTTWANPPCVLTLLTNLLLIPSCIAICNDYNYKETKIGESGYRSRSLSNANRALYHLSESPWEMILFTNLFLISSRVAICNEYMYKETKIGESGYRTQCLSNANRALYHLSESPWEVILFTNLFHISSWVAISNEYNYKETEIGESGYRSRWLPNTNREFYQLS